MKLKTHLAQEEEDPQELGPGIKGFTEKSAHQYKCYSFVVMSTSSECSEDLLFDFCVLKFQNVNQQTSNNVQELKQHLLPELKRSWLLLNICLLNLLQNVSDHPC